MRVRAEVRPARGGVDRGARARTVARVRYRRSGRCARAHAVAQLQVVPRYDPDATRARSPHGPVARTADAGGRKRSRGRYRTELRLRQSGPLCGGGSREVRRGALPDAAHGPPAARLDTTP